MTRRKEMIKALASTPGDLKLILKNKSIQELKQEPQPGRWPPLEVVFHLVDVEKRYLTRLQRVANENQPNLPFILPPDEGYEIEYETINLISDFENARRETLNFLRSQKAGIWQRKAILENGETLSFRYFVQHLVEHDTEHLNQILVG